jgi:hypothetical protein
VVARATLPLLLVLTALSLDAVGARGVAVYALLAAIPAAAAYALDRFGRLVVLAGRAPGLALARAETAAAFLGLLLVVAVAASRAPAAVAPLGESALVAAAVFFAVATAAEASRAPVRGTEPQPAASAAAEPDARAA